MEQPDSSLPYSQAPATEAIPYVKVSVRLDAPAALSPGKSFLVPFEHEDGRVEEPVWTLKKTNVSCPYRELSPDSPVFLAPSLITIPTELTRLQFLIHLTKPPVNCGV